MREFNTYKQTIQLANRKRGVWMEYSLNCKNSALPCQVIADEDNGRFMLRNADTSGEYFNSAEEMMLWIKNNWRDEDFNDPQELEKVINELKQYSTQ
ncbi:hypothetical protein LC040_02535 [Bacillus tianshenii]|nr:hypothetical protein LC040_02535 [Bacillus tianshenii]